MYTYILLILMCMRLFIHNNLRLLLNMFCKLILQVFITFSLGSYFSKIHVPAIKPGLYLLQTYEGVSMALY